MESMVKCEFCVSFDGKRCTDPKGVMYGKDIKNSMMEIECDRYIDNYLLFDMIDDLF